MSTSDQCSQVNPRFNWDWVTLAEHITGLKKSQCVNAKFFVTGNNLPSAMLGWDPV